MPDEVVRWRPAANLQEMAEQLIMTIETKALVDGCAHGLWAKQCFDTNGRHYVLTVSALSQEEPCEVCSAADTEAPAPPAAP